MYPAKRIVCLTEETVETLYLMGEGERIVGVSGFVVRPPEARRKPKVSTFTDAKIDEILALKPDLVFTFSDIQADITANLMRAGLEVHAFNHRTIDGIDLQSTPVESLHEQIGIVTQENFLFTGTVMENLKFGKPGASDDEVRAAAKTLGTHDIILRLTDGYQTKVSERGGNFSAGERQLLTFTRAMVAQPRILILDEATSAVDAQTEGVIQRALEELFARRTCFVVAHRLSTVRHAHQILVLNHGEIVERGTHDELIARNGHYATLHAEFVRQ